MKKKEPLPGYEVADREIHSAIFKATIETRVLLKLLRELKKTVRDANRWGTVAYFGRDMTDYMNRGIAGNLQRLTRQVNTARRAVIEFQKVNSKVD